MGVLFLIQLRASIQSFDEIANFVPPLRIVGGPFTTFVQLGALGNSKGDVMKKNITTINEMYVILVTLLDFSFENNETNIPRPIEDKIISEIDENISNRINEDAA